MTIVSFVLNEYQNFIIEYFFSILNCLIIFVFHLLCLQMRLYQVVGRKAPTAGDENPPAYRMKLFARNEVMAKSRFWYFMHQMRKMKKTTGEILDVNEVCSNLGA